MRKMLGILAAAGLLALGAGSASAQGVSVRIGVGEPGYRPGYHRVMRNHYRPVVERRIVRRAPARTVCRTVIRQHVRGNGVVVRRPVEVCRRTFAGRRVYVD